MPVKGERLKVEPLTQREVLALIHECNDGATGIRNKALIVVMWRAGLRINEALALYEQDLDPREGTIRVHKGKGNKPRVAGMDPMAFSLVDQWIECRQKRGITHRNPLFCTLQGTELSQSYVRHMLPRLATRAGIRKRVHPHGLRHTFALELINEGTPIHVISKALGHSSVATTAVYLEHINPQEVTDTIRHREFPTFESAARTAKSGSR